MSAKLAVITAQVGTVSETFVRKHIEGIAPGDTVAVALRSRPLAGGRWDAGCPVLYLDEVVTKWPVRLAHRVGRSWAELRANAVAQFLRQHGVGVVLGEYLDQFVEFVPMLDRLAIPYVTQGHGIDLSASLRNADTARSYGAYRSARAVLTRCEFHRRRLIDLGLPAERVHVNPGGVDLPDETPVRPPEAGKRLLAVGRMVAKKGPIYTLEAFRRAAARDPELHLDYVGGGDLEDAVAQFVIACDLKDRVTLHGAVSEATKARLLSECGVFVQHSLTDPATGDEEGLPAAIQEAMANALPVISTRHAGIPEAVVHGETGLIIDEGDVNGMAAAMLAIAPMAAAFGQAGRRRAQANYGWPHERARLAGWLFGEAPPGA
ncbi:MAG TPA: glycosyltransferase [Caulobacteraceae bacterium]|nr:glycosyltransferase [Caulobacteraceae bacterium]